MDQSLQQTMKKRAILYSMLMSICLSFCLSLFGTATSGHFTVVSFLASFGISTVLSLIINFVIPMKLISLSIERKIASKPVSFLVKGLVSDIIFTPFITAAMIAMASSNAPVSFMDLFPKAFAGSMVVGLLCILLFQLVFGRLVVPPASPQE